MHTSFLDIRGFGQASAHRQPPHHLETFQPGDILGFSECSLSGAAINLATWGCPGWGLSHVGIVAMRPGTTRQLLWESTSLCPLPCDIQARVVSGVQAHRLWARLRTFAGRVWVYRLTTPLTEAESTRLSLFVWTHLGVSYDFLGAFRLRVTPLGLLEQLLCPEELHSLFCSELLAAALRHIGRHGDHNASRWSPNRLCRHLVRAGIYCPAVRIK